MTPSTSAQSGSDLIVTCDELILGIQDTYDVQARKESRFCGMTYAAYLVGEVLSAARQVSRQTTHSAIPSGAAVTQRSPYILRHVTFGSFTSRMPFNRNRTTLLRIVAAAALLTIPALPLYGQYENGSLLGTIRDESGAAIPHSIVTVTNVATGVGVSAKADGEGNYDVPQLRVGVYTVKATATGFSSAVAQNITVSVGNRQHIDLALKVGGNETSVEVSDIEIQVETESSQRDQTITNQQTEGLPLVNRNLYRPFGNGERCTPGSLGSHNVEQPKRGGAPGGVQRQWATFSLQ